MKLIREKAASGLASDTAFSKTKLPKHHTKKTSILKVLVNVGDRGLDCFQAAIQYRDFVLRSTISDLQRDYDLEISREWVKVPNQFGSKTDCVRYWLDEANRAKAIKLLSQGEVL